MQGRQDNVLHLKQAYVAIDDGVLVVNDRYGYKTNLCDDVIITTKNGGASVSVAVSRRQFHFEMYSGEISQETADSLEDGEFYLEKRYKYFGKTVPKAKSGYRLLKKRERRIYTTNNYILILDGNELR